MLGLQGDGGRIRSSGPTSTLRWQKRRVSEDQAIGRPRYDLSTKIHMAFGVLGCPVWFSHSDRTDRFGNRTGLRRQYVDLSQLRDDLIGLVLVLRHRGILKGSKAYFTDDQFSGGGPKLSEPGAGSPGSAFGPPRGRDLVDRLCSSPAKSAYRKIGFDRPIVFSSTGSFHFPPVAIWPVISQTSGSVMSMPRRS